MVVWLYPYLPLTRRVTVGPWTLVPIADLQDADAANAQAVEVARGVAALYRLDGDRRGFGAFIRGDQPVGEELEETGLSWLRLAVVTAMLDQNPSLADAGEENPNAGHGMCTTENALLAGHGVDEDGFTGFSRGTIVSVLVGGARVGESRDVIAPPSELMLPIFRPQLDDVYLVALYEVLANLTPDSPDLPGAIRWLEVGWSNSRTVSQQAHVLALRAGFDVLFGGAETVAVRGKLSALLDLDGAPRASREWDDHRGRHLGPFELTDLEWWFQSFALLRNRIAHGGDVPAADWNFDDDVPHVWHAERTLRRAIKQIVAAAGHEDVLLDRFERVTRRVTRLFIADQ